MTTQQSVLIQNRRGLHARASAKFVTLASAQPVMVTVEKPGSGSVTGTSIMGLMMLAASPGCCVMVSATGNQAVDVLDALERLVADRFGEEM